MRGIVTIFAIIYCTFLLSQDDLMCKIGDCESGFGIIENADTTIIEFGFRIEGKLNGAGYKRSENGHFIFSNFKNDLPTGNSVYFVGEGSRQHGVFKKGLKEGVHVIINDSNLSESILVTYERDIEISREIYKLDNKKMHQDCSGDCENGYGAKVDISGQIIIGFFENSVFTRGEVIDNDKKTVTIYNINEEGLDLGIYTMDFKRENRTEIFKVLLYSEVLGGKANKTSIYLTSNSHKITGVEYDGSGKQKNIYSNF